MKKTFIVYLLSLSGLLGVAGHAQNKPVTIYSDEFAGSHADLTNGKYTYVDLVRLGMALVRSVKVPEGTMIIFYDNDNFQGSSLTLTDDANQRLLSNKGFGQVASNISIEVKALPAELMKAPYVTIYKDNFSGPSRKLRAGTYDFFELGGVDNDALSSIKIPKGMKVTLYEHGQLGGRSIELKEDAGSATLIGKKFNDITSSIVVELLPEPDPVKPVVVVTTTTQLPDPAPEKEVEINGPFATIFFGNGSKRFPVGRFDAAAIGQDRTLNGIRLPEGLRVVLYGQPGFKGPSLTIDEDGATKSYFESNKFPSVASLTVESIPSVTLFEGAYTGDSRTFYDNGTYYLSSLGIGNDELSSVKIGAGFWVLLFEDDGLQGRSLLLTKDASADFLAGRDFDDKASSIVIGKTNDPLPQVSLFQDDLTGQALKLTPGEYPHLDLNNSISSADLPRGIRLTLYDEPDFGGKSIELMTPVRAEYLGKVGFDNVASSAKIELLKPRDYTVTIYVDRYSGFGQDLIPGKYMTRDLKIGDNQLSSIHVPAGMQVTLYEHDNFKGLIQKVDRDTDFSDSRYQNDIFSSLIVEDVYAPVIRGVPVVTTTVEKPVVIIETVVPVVEKEKEVTTVAGPPPCEMTEKEFYLALKAIEAKAFSGEKMSTARLATQNKCLSLDQIRSIAQQFAFEDQTLEFVKYAYDLSSDKSTYYTLDNVFKFMSSKDAFAKFLESK